MIGNNEKENKCDEKCPCFSNNDDNNAPTLVSNVNEKKDKLTRKNRNEDLEELQKILESY